jgi:hypothetical protein
MIMRLSKGVLQNLHEQTKISVPALSDYAATRKRPGRKRALDLEKACKDLGYDVPAIVWLYDSSEEIKSRLSNGNGSEGGGSNQNEKGFTHASAESAGVNQG